MIISGLVIETAEHGVYLFSCQRVSYITFFNPSVLSISLSLTHSATIRNAFLLLLVATSTWLCGLMAVNNSILAFYYIFNVLCLVQV